MKKFITIVFCICSLAVQAQHRLSGTIMDQANGEAVAYATAALMAAEDSSIFTIYEML